MRHKRSRTSRAFNPLDPFGGKGTGNFLDFAPPKHRDGMGGIFGGSMPGANLDFLGMGAPQRPRRVRRRKPKVVYRPKRRRVSYENVRYPRKIRYFREQSEVREHQKPGVNWRELGSRAISVSKRVGASARERLSNINKGARDYNSLRSKYASGGWKALSDAEKKQLTSEAIKRGEYL